MTMALLWQDPQRAIGLTGKLIRREDWSELLASNEALQRARQCEHDSQHKAAAAEQAARQRGFEAGLAQGREEGLRQVLQRLRDEQAFVRRLREQQVELLSHALADLLGNLPIGDVLRAQVQHCLDAARREQGSRLLVAPAQVEPARALVRECLSLDTTDWPDWLELLPSAELHDGDVVLEAHGAILDGRVQAQLSAWQRQVGTLLDSEGGPAHAG
jgi:flagellar biosynthesis/type III secretory pathway protein FliH